MKQALIYCRFSPRPNADECQSNEKQIERCLAYCENAGPVGVGYVVCGTYSDVAVSGKILDRPELSLAIERLKPGMVLVVDTCDRLARDMLVNLTIRHQIERAGATLEFADGSPNYDTPEGKLFSHILAAFAAYERDRIAARTSAGLKRKQAAGQHLGKAPVGFEVDPNTKQLVTCEHEQAAMRKIVAMSAAGVKKSEYIAMRITSIHGLFRGNPWSARTVRKIISNNS
jgi:DNA invertase Pin-like site-specific DNA recombinase